MYEKNRKIWSGDKVTREFEKKKTMGKTAPSLRRLLGKIYGRIKFIYRMRRSDIKFLQAETDAFEWWIEGSC